jgi:hypothetical protein
MLKASSTEADMKKAIAIGILGLSLFAGRAAAQTVEEQARILREFQDSVADYTQRHTRLDLFPEAQNATRPAPKVFTLPVAMVFRQLIARAVTPPGGAAIGGVHAAHRATVLQPFPTTELTDFPKILSDVLPTLPAPLEYRLIDNDLVIRDAHADLIIAVLRNALGVMMTRH